MEDDPISPGVVEGHLADADGGALDELDALGGVRPLHEGGRQGKIAGFRVGPRGRGIGSAPALLGTRFWGGRLGGNGLGLGAEGVGGEVGLWCAAAPRTTAAVRCHRLVSVRLGVSEPGAQVVVESPRSSWREETVFPAVRSGLKYLAHG